MNNLRKLLIRINNKFYNSNSNKVNNLRKLLIKTNNKFYSNNSNKLILININQNKTIA